MDLFAPNKEERNLEAEIAFEERLCWIEILAEQVATYRLLKKLHARSNPLERVILEKQLAELERNLRDAI